LLSASTQPRPLGREILGDSWRSVGIACRPQFVKRDLLVAADGLPAELRRFQSGDTDVDFFFAGPLTLDMKSAVTTLMHPAVQGPMRPVYLQAKVVELMCLALDRLRRPEQKMPQGLRLSRRDLECLQSVHKMLQHCHMLPSLAQIARRVGLNRRKLAVGFKHVYGLTIGAFYRERRLSIARELLDRGTVSIGRAAGLAGYNDAGSFSKAFRAQFGFLPSELPHPVEIAPRESRK
jgi:AraC-like DNA-binding protein